MRKVNSTRCGETRPSCPTGERLNGSICSKSSTLTVFSAGKHASPHIPESHEWVYSLEKWLYTGERGQAWGAHDGKTWSKWGVGGSLSSHCWGVDQSDAKRQLESSPTHLWERVPTAVCKEKSKNQRGMTASQHFQKWENMQERTQCSMQRRCVFPDLYQAHKMRVWKQGVGDGGKWEWRPEVTRPMMIVHCEWRSVWSPVICVHGKNKSGEQISKF